MPKQLTTRSILILSAWILASTGALTGPARAGEIIHYATGYPIDSITEFNPSMTCYVDKTFSNTWFVTAFPLVITQTTEITGIAGIGSDAVYAGTSFLNDFDAEINVFSSPGAFADQGLVGDVERVFSVGIIEGPNFVGADSFGLSLYYMEFSFTPFTLAPGTYWVSVPVWSFNGSWGWVESSIDLGGAIFTDSEHVGAYGSLVNNGPFTNGTMAFDVIGNVISSPCIGDADGNSIVNFDDIVATLSTWLVNYGSGTGLGDSNADGVVNFDDITSTLSNWLQTCP